MRHVIGETRKRPRLCVACKEPASWAVVAMEATTTIKRDGTVRRLDVPRSTYWCATHVADTVTVS